MGELSFGPTSSQKQQAIEAARVKELVTCSFNAIQDAGCTLDKERAMMRVADQVAVREMCLWCGQRKTVAQDDVVGKAVSQYRPGPNFPLVPRYCYDSSGVVFGCHGVRANAKTECYRCRLWQATLDD